MVNINVDLKAKPYNLDDESIKKVAKSSPLANVKKSD